MGKWTHPGGKIIELGPAALTDEELLAILIGRGYKGRVETGRRKTVSLKGLIKTSF